MFNERKRDQKASRRTSNASLVKFREAKKNGDTYLMICLQYEKYLKAHRDYIKARHGAQQVTSRTVQFCIKSREFSATQN